MDIAQMERYIERNPVKYILHLAAIADRNIADRQRQLSYDTNVRGTANVALVAGTFKKKMIYISTDYVFSGLQGGYKEEDRPEPANWYGFTKYAGELEVMGASDEYLIIRTSFRPTVWGYPTAYTNVFTSADYVDIIAKEILKCLECNVSGIIHIGTPKKTLYELAIQRNLDVLPEECLVPQHRDLSIKKWEDIKYKNQYHSA